MASSLFVTGTDTGVGKTLVSAALLHALARRHARVVGMKPVAAGLVDGPDGAVSEDVLALRAASTLRVPPELDNPVALSAPMSPHLAAAREGRCLEVAALHAAWQSLAARADVVVVEGAGGWYTPINDAQTLADLARVIGAPVVLVVGLRLGCLNHALLTVDAVRAAGLPLAGWVANRIDPDMSAADENIETQRLRIAAPMLGVVPWGATPQEAAARLALPEGLA
jgi:dethiobiotin synthetase